ncbi:MAG: hypothetical protein J7M38_02150, partial [Armatimonadetes bacterium]|nr:hypothetical protein [Armatimonadota bacterium]
WSPISSVGQSQHSNVPSAEGTFECWLCPTEDIGDHRDEEHYMRTILDIGPVRYDYPYLTNYRSLAAYINKYGWLVFQITNEKYKSRMTQCRVLDWKAGQWRHLACQWKLDDAGRCRLAIYVDGKMVADKVTGNRDGEPDAALRRKDEVLPIQVGAMNTGFGPAKMLIDELRFSRTWRYSGDFDPADRLEADGDTTLLFHFDGDLQAESGLQGVDVTGEPGTVG